MLKKTFFIFLSSLFVSMMGHANSLTFLPATDPLLCQEAKPVDLEDLKSDATQLFIHKMLVLAGFESDPVTHECKPRLVGVAAPQVGHLKQIIVIDSSTHLHNKKGQVKPSFEVLVNPQILWRSEKKESIPQGCYSVPEAYVGLVERSNSIIVKALDANGEPILRRYSGYTAHVVQHEMDHLKGIRFPELLKSEADLHFFPEGEKDLPKYRKSWKKWPHHASYELWQQLKCKNYTS